MPTTSITVADALVWFEFTTRYIVSSQNHFDSLDMSVDEKNKIREEIDKLADFGKSIPYCVHLSATISQ